MINRTYQDIYSNVGSNVRDTSSAMQTEIKRFVNDVYFDFLRRTNYEAINEDYSFTATTQDNILPSDFGKALKVYDTTNNIELVQTDIKREVQNNVATIDSSGTARRYVILSRAVRTQPTSASTLSISSSDATDTTQTVFIRGIVSDVETTESVTLTGTTPAVTSNSYTRIITISKDASTAGTVTVTSNSGAVTVAVFSTEAKDHKAKIMRLYNSPASSVVINAPYIIKPSPLNNDDDVPIVDAGDIIEAGATAMSLQFKRQFAKAEEWTKRYERGIVQYVWDRENEPDLIQEIRPVPYSRETV